MHTIIASIYMYTCVSDCAVLVNINLHQFTQSQVLDCDRRANTPEKLSIALLLLLFTTDELAHGNCSKPTRDITQLDTKRVWAINYM